MSNGLIFDIWKYDQTENWNSAAELIKSKIIVAIL